MPNIIKNRHTSYSTRTAIAPEKLLCAGLFVAGWREVVGQGFRRNPEMPVKSPFRCVAGQRMEAPAVKDLR